MNVRAFVLFLMCHDFRLESKPEICNKLLTVKKNIKRATLKMRSSSYNLYFIKEQMNILEGNGLMVWDYIAFSESSFSKCVLVLMGQRGRQDIKPERLQRKSM